MSRSDNQQPHVSFDDDYRVRVLDKESIAHTQELEIESNQFATSAWRMIPTLGVILLSQTIFWVYCPRAG